MSCAVIVFLELQLTQLVLPCLRQGYPRDEGVRFGNFIPRFQVCTLVPECEELTTAVRPDRFDGEIGRCRQYAGLGGGTKAGRDVVLENLNRQRARAE